MSGIVVISNPRSGQNRKSPHFLRRITDILGDQGELVLPDGLDKLEETIVSIKQRQKKVLCINGGDGTIHQVVSAMFRVYQDDAWPQIALLAGGTMNNIARNVGVRKKPEELLKEIILGQSEAKAYEICKRNIIIKSLFFSSQGSFFYNIQFMTHTFSMQKEVWFLQASHSFESHIL